MVSHPDLSFRRDLSWWESPEDFASVSQSPSSQPKEAAKAQGVRRLLLRQLPSRHPATVFETVWSERRVSAAESLPANVGLSRNQLVVREPEPA